MALALLLTLGLLGSWLPRAEVARAATLTFAYTGAAQEWVVPAGVTSATFDLYGAQGGDTSSEVTGGRGGRATATLAVTPGATVVIVVGGAGGVAPRCGTALGGANGGGQGGTGTFCGAGGGGASDVRFGGAALDDRVLVAGGGGGAANGISTCGASNGGAGGGAAGGAGVSASCEGDAPGGGQVTGSGSGQPGAGGAGTSVVGFFSGGGGGGGGGYYGGAGGGQYTGGGGGSGYGPVGTTLESGVRAGDGQVILSYVVAQTIDFPQPPDRNYGTAPYVVAAIGGGSGNPVTFATTTPAVCAASGTNGATITLVGLGICTVAADQAGNADYSAAPQVVRSFAVLAPIPTATGIAPAALPVGSADTAVTITGTGFVPGAGSVVYLDGVALATTRYSDTQLTATVPAARLATAGGYPLNIVTPGPGGGTSNTITLTVAAAPPAPASASVAPASLAFGARQVGTVSDSQQVVLTNGGGSPLTVPDGGVTIVGSQPGDFAVTFTTCVGAIPAGGSCVVGVRFAPTAEGDRAATLQIADSAAGGPRTVALTGSGTPPPPTPQPRSVVTASAQGQGAVTPAGSTSYATGGAATYAATPGAGQIFLGWTLDGQFVGYASPLTFTVEANRTLVAQFAARPSFGDVSATDPDYEAVTRLAALGIVNPRGVNGSGRFEPERPVARAEVAALVARLYGWDREFHANPFPDRCAPDGGGCVDDELWNTVAALADYGVVGGYTDPATCGSAGTTAPCYLPRDSVNRLQVVSVVARAFTRTPDLRPTGYWDRLPAVPGQYANVPDAGTQRSDLATYRANAGPVPGQAGDDQFPDPSGAASRRFIIQVLFGAYQAQFGTDRVP